MKYGVIYFAANAVIQCMFMRGKNTLKKNPILSTLAKALRAP